MEQLENLIHIIRGQKVMLDSDLARLYGVSVKRLNEQVKRNAYRFPKDFMYQLTMKEVRILRSQIATLGWGDYSKYLPYAFTEQGVAMLSGVLNSKKAIKVNVQIMRVFVNMRRAIEQHKDLAEKMQELEAKVGAHDKTINQIFEVIKKMMELPNSPKKRIGFHNLGKL